MSIMWLQKRYDGHTRYHQNNQLQPFSSVNILSGQRIVLVHKTSIIQTIDPLQLIGVLSTQRAIDAAICLFVETWTPIY